MHLDSKLEVDMSILISDQGQSCEEVDKYQGLPRTDLNIYLSKESCQSWQKIEDLTREKKLVSLSK